MKQLNPFSRPLAFYGLFLVILLSSCSLNAQQTINVPADYLTIQEALDAATEDATINVGAGTYVENLSWPNVDGIKLIGINGRENTIIDGNGEYRVIEMLDTLTATTLIDGFTIQNGLYDDDDSSTTGIGGAGLYARNSNSTLNNLIIQDNKGIGARTYGAGAYLLNYSGKIENCVFRNNTINTDTRAYGIGLNVEVNLYAEIINCDFDNNLSVTGNFGYGGGLYLRNASSINGICEVDISNCSFTNNSISAGTNSDGAGIYVGSIIEVFKINIDSCSFLNNQVTSSSGLSGGGAIYNTASILNVSNSILNGNTSDEGSALYYWTTGISPEINLTSNTYSNNKSESTDGSSTLHFSYSVKKTLSNNIISHNNTTYTIKDESSSEDFNIINSTFAYNEGPLLLTNSELISTNSIYWNLDTIEFDANEFSNNFILKNCLVKNGITGENIIDSDPLFVSENILVPTANSPCLGTGTLDNFTAHDIEGFERPMPANSNPDIGAYEVNENTSLTSIKFYYDINQDGVKDTGEEYMAHGAVNLNDETFNNFTKEGLALRLDQGNQTLAFDDISSNEWFTTSQEEYQLIVDSDDFFQEIEFGLYPSVPNSLTYKFIQGDAFRCGEEIRMSINVKNLGTDVESGILLLDIDGRLDDFSFEIAPDITNSTNQVGWEFTNLYPFESFKINYSVTAPLIQSEEELGEIYFFKADLQSTLTADLTCYNAELRCSYDPNDKLVSPDREDQLALLDEHLFYTIRFQNTGNDYAKNVVVRDTLDPNLDIRTFSLAGTSHPDVLEVVIEENNVIAFEFKDIFLLDSLTNFEASNGHVSYLIKPFEGLPEETVIKNTGHIYFDFNPAIVTNTTNTILVEEFPTVSNDDILITPILLYPNPTDQIVNFSQTVDKGQIYNINGLRVTSFGKSQSIDVSTLTNGIYFIEMEVNGEVWKEKFIVLR